jgi:hypothetical protein
MSIRAIDYHRQEKIFRVSDLSPSARLLFKPFQQFLTREICTFSNSEKLPQLPLGKGQRKSIPCEGRGQTDMQLVQIH